MTVYTLTGNNRRLIADVLDGLDDEQWTTETLCAGWTVREMAAHLVQPMLVGFGKFFLVAMRYRGNTDRTVDHVTRRIARRERGELLRLLREHAGDRVNPPRVGPMGPFAETCVHLRDIARPLGLAADVPAEHWRILLDYLAAPGAAPGLVRPGRLAGVRLQATDIDWAAGDGPVLRGTAEALAMAVTGRDVVLPELSGPGVLR
ncbi:maleylpyruvate isomerase family mycothiol-dependent enzyme [Actinoplanes sp. HUAS TT8]|uniref:maleylpyruvate isomerase family mycothiol-dependent enzyme n=1 Tax=Actinoplanes sp. HUAS TT8 TaxID=3447453 RepID=UPI003F51E070